MTEQDDYLWSGEGAVDDPFVAELEARLAPLDDAEELLAGIELDGLAARELEASAFADQIHIVPDPTAPLDEPVARDEVVQLRPAEAKQAANDAPAPTGSGWLWLAAAVAVLGLSVGVLATGMQASSGPRGVDITGAAAAASRVLIDAPADLHAPLRSAHASLSDCALGLEPGASMTFELSVHQTLELSGATNADDQTLICVEAAVERLQLSRATPARVGVELRGPAADE